MLVLKFNDIITNQVQQQQQQYQYFKIILSRYSNQHFQIKKAYTKFSGRWSKGSDAERQIDYVQENLDVNLVAKLVNAFNGIEIIINTPQELYEMYQILHFFQIQELQNQIEKFLIQDKSSILIGYQLSELYEIESLSNFYFEYFKEYGFLGIFNKKLDKEKARKHIYKNKSRLVPLHYLYLQANLFKKLLILHNHLAIINFDKNKFLDQFQIALLISEYCLTNGYDRIKLQEIFSDAVIKDQVTNEQKQIILIEFEKQYKKNQMRTVSSISYSEEDDSSDTTIEVKNKNSETIISQIPIIEPIEIYRGKELDPKLLIGLKNLQFHFKTKHTSFGFYVSKKIELNTQIQDEQLQLINLSTKVQLNTSLRVNWIKFDENSLNVNNRLIIIRSKGICRYEEDVNEPQGQIRLTGCRNFRIQKIIKDFHLLFKLIAKPLCLFIQLIYKSYYKQYQMSFLCKINQQIINQQQKRYKYGILAFLPILEIWVEIIQFKFVMIFPYIQKLMEKSTINLQILQCNKIQILLLYHPPSLVQLNSFQ